MACAIILILCIVDCGAPLFPPNTNTTVSDTTVGAIATFQCEERLIPSGPITSTCTDTETGGQWLPNPADTQCTDSPGIHYISCSLAETIEGALYCSLKFSRDLGAVQIHEILRKYYTHQYTVHYYKKNL